MSVPNYDDVYIKNLLSSQWNGAVGRGLKIVDLKYRSRVFGFLRGWSNSCGAQFSADDLAEIWQETFVSFAKNARGGSFNVRGSLWWYLRTIAWRRAVDKVRRRMKREKNREKSIDPAMLEACCDKGLCELLEEIETCYGKLTDGLKIILQIDLALFQQNMTWVRLEELTEAVNQNGQPELSMSAVKSRRARAHSALREHLEERGISW